MEADYRKLYTELRKTKQELQERLNSHVTIEPFIKEEIQDIEIAMNKILTGSYGRCEQSGELIPKEILDLIPTIKSLKDMESIGHFFRKPIY
jgi:RNA polymerase-binding transcription factor DksA